MTSSMARRRVSKRCPCRRSTFGDPNSVSLQALSQQLPRRLIEAVMPYSVSTSLTSLLASVGALRGPVCVVAGIGFSPIAGCHTEYLHEHRVHVALCSEARGGRNRR